MKIFKNKLLKGALVLSIGGLITKVLGAFYRIPLTNLLGAEGIGIYQAVFPLYSLLLTASSTGVPNGIAKIISSDNSEFGAYVTFKSALKIFIPIGVVGTLILSVFCFYVAKLQGNTLAWISYLTISPSVLLVSIISCFRGFFQGKLDMKPTAISQIIEQFIKLTVGLSLCYFVKGNVEIKAGLATTAVTVSELITVIYLFTLFKKRGYSLKFLKEVKTKVKSVFKTVFPVMLSTVVIPLARTIESFFVLNILNAYTLEATALYGLYSGAVESLVGVPVSVCYAVAVASVPVISKAVSTGEKVGKKITESLIYTLIGGVVSAFAFIFLSKTVVSILYGKLNDYHKTVTVNLLKISSLSVILLPLMQTTTSIIIALGKECYPPISAGVSVAIKLIISFLLLHNPKINVFGVVLSDILCYFVATFLNLMYIIYIISKKRRGTKWVKLSQSA